MKLRNTERAFEHLFEYLVSPESVLKPELQQLSSLGTVPEFEEVSHHRCHAASAFYPSNFEEALVLTIDSRGENESTVVCEGGDKNIQKLRSYSHDNSLGRLYTTVTEFLGFRANNGEGKIMGLAPYGNTNAEIRDNLTEELSFGVEYDVTPVTKQTGAQRVQKLSSILGREQSEDTAEFTHWEKDLAFVCQQLTEEAVVSIVESYLSEVETENVCLAGGVALNCKLNKRVRESEAVNRTWIQPVAHDSGIIIGAGMATFGHGCGQNHVYLGDGYTNDEISDFLDSCKLSYKKDNDFPGTVAAELADGKLVGWFQDRDEIGPRALGNRSILADPRTAESRDRVNRSVKHREEWRPFAPSILEEGADNYLQEYQPSPFMIDTFNIVDEKQDEIPAVLHPADHTTRPQTVTEEDNYRYYQVLIDFKRRTGVPVILNTSFNDHGEPIVHTPAEAVKDFFGMGLDLLAIGDCIVRKES